MSSTPQSRNSRRVAALALPVALFVLAAIGPISSAQADANSIAQTIGASGGSISATSSGQQYAQAASPFGGFPTAGTDFAVISSGDATVSSYPNDAENTSTDFMNSDPTRGLAFDPATLKADFTVPQGQSCLQLDFKFLSEEFPEYVNAGFNDGFVAELDGTSWSIVDDSNIGPKLSAPDDFAAGYGDQVAVDTVGPTIVSEADAAGTTYDAATGILTARTPVTPGPHSVYLSVFDAGDGIYDSAVFLDNLRFTNDPASTCRPADLFGGKVGADPSGKSISFKGNTGTFKVTCELPEGANAPCVGNALVTAPGGGKNRVLARSKKTTKVAKGKYSIDPATTGKVAVKLTGKGKKLLKGKKSVKGTLKLTNTVNAKSGTFKVRLKG